MPDEQQERVPYEVYHEAEGCVVENKDRGFRTCWGRGQDGYQAAMNVAAILNRSITDVIAQRSSD